MNANAEQKSFSGFYERCRQFLGRLRNAMNFSIPLGYEDVDGFHYGAAPARIEVEKK